MYRPPRHHEGFTLPELLLAIGISVIILVLAGSIYLTATRSTEGTDQRSSRLEEVAGAMDQLALDLIRCVPAGSEGRQAFLLIQDGATAGTLAFTAAIPSAGEENPGWYGLQRIIYQWNTQPDNNSLLRISRPETGPGSRSLAETNLLTGCIQSLTAACFDGTEWVDTWGPERTETTPFQIRLTVEPEGAAAGPEPLGTVITIPAGMTFTSSIERAASAAAPLPGPAAPAGP